MHDALYAAAIGRLIAGVPNMWLDAASTHFDGTVIVGKDLLEI